jgi:hypothetical protein
MQLINSGKYKDKFMIDGMIEITFPQHVRIPYKCGIFYSSVDEGYFVKIVDEYLGIYNDRYEALYALYCDWI